MRKDEEAELTKQTTVPQVLPYEAEACKGAKAEPPDPSMDSPEDGQHNQVWFHWQPTRKKGKTKGRGDHDELSMNWMDKRYRGAEC